MLHVVSQDTHRMQYEGSLQRSQGPATEPDESTPHPQTQHLQDQFLYYLCRPRSFQWSLPYNFPTEILYPFHTSTSAYYIHSYPTFPNLITIMLSGEGIR
jgi:hypothetical protein